MRLAAPRSFDVIDNIRFLNFALVTERNRLVLATHKSKMFCSCQTLNIFCRREIHGRKYNSQMYIDRCLGQLRGGLFFFFFLRLFLIASLKQVRTEI